MAKKCFDDGGQALLEKTKRSAALKSMGREEPTYLGSVKDTLQDYKDRAVNALTPNIVNTIRQKQQATQQAIDDADQGKAKGGKIKHKAKAKTGHRGDGKAERGRTKGRML